MAPCKVAYIFTPISFGGAERVNLTFLRQVDRTRFSVFPALLLRPWEQENLIVTALAEEGYPIHQVPVALRPRSEGRDPLRIVRCFRSIHAFLRNGSFDLVHTHGYFADIIAAPAARLLGLPHLATCHGFIMTTFPLRLYNWADRLALRSATKVIAVSDAIRGQLVRSGIPEKRIVTIPNAVSGPLPDQALRQRRSEKRRELGTDGDGFIIGYAGRLSEEKGLTFLIRACAELRDEGLPVRAFILGEGPQREELEELAKQKSLEGQVVFAGFQNDIENWLPMLDAFVLPSLTEGTPLALLEAMACGIPSVGTAVGGVPQVIDPDRTGILVPPGDPGALAAAVRRLYRSAALRSAIAREAKRAVCARYGVRDWTRKIEAEYLQMLH